LLFKKTSVRYRLFPITAGIVPFSPQSLKLMEEEDKAQKFDGRGLLTGKLSRLLLVRCKLTFLLSRLRLNKRIICLGRMIGST